RRDAVEPAVRAARARRPAGQVGSWRAGAGGGPGRAAGRRALPADLPPRPAVDRGTGAPGRLGRTGTVAAFGGGVLPLRVAARDRERLPGTAAAVRRVRAATADRHRTGARRAAIPRGHGA